MALTIRAHFDGKVIVPDEPVDLPVDQRLEVQVKPIPSEAATPVPDPWQAALNRLVARARHGLNIPDEALRREKLYEERL
jgi:hypothetical protein